MAGNQNSGRRPIPNVVHMVRGNPSKKNLDGGSDDLINWGLVAEMPTCPPHLTEYAKEEWDRIAPDLFMIGLINKLDQAELAIYCQAYGDWRQAREMVTALQARQRDALVVAGSKSLPSEGFVDQTPSGYKQIGVWLQIANRAEERMRAAGQAFGFNPSARSKVTALPRQGELFDGDEREVAGRYF